MTQNAVVVQAVYDYTRKHTDELSFKRGDKILVSRQLDGGWWEGSLNGVTGWFPSNYVMQVMDNVSLTDSRTSDEQFFHLQTFQDEIVQHILEGEVRQVNELSQLVSCFLVHLEPFAHLSFLNKVNHMKELLNQAIHLHQALASALDQMKQSNEPKRVGKLFLDFAPTINAIGCDYSKIHLYVVTGIDKNADAIERHLSLCGVKFQLTRCKQQLSLVFDRLGRYPLLLKEMERYLENPHVDRTDIQRAMSVYGEITERCAILRKFKEYDIDILLSTIHGWQGVSIDKLGDPILTLRVLLTSIEYDLSIGQSANVGTNGQLSVLVIFPACVLLLARRKQMDMYEFTKKVPLNCLTVIGCFDTETDIDLLVTDLASERDSVRPCRISLTCTDKNARDLLVSTLTDLIQYQTQVEQARPDRSLHERNQPAVSDRPPTGSTTTITYDITTTQLSLQREQTEYSGIPSEPELNESTEQLSQLSGRSRSSTGQDVATTHHHPTATTTSTQQSSDRDESSSHGSVAGDGTCSKDQSHVSPSVHSVTASKALKTTPAPLSPSPSTGIRILPHSIQTNPHVHWLGIDTTCHGKENNNNSKHTSPSRVLRSLRLDGPLNMNHSSYPHSSATSYVNWGAGVYTQSSENDPNGHVVVAHVPGSSHYRPHSPKGEAGREIRRKKSDPLQLFCGQSVFISRKDRQKSAINVDEVLRSVGGIRDSERRNADAARILQVVEAYCASAWTQLSCRSLDQSKEGGTNSRVCSSILSPTESKTLLQQVMAPSLIHGQTRSATKNLTDQHSLIAETPMQPSSKASSSKSSGLSASAIVRSVAKRSGSTKQPKQPDPLSQSETTTPMRPSHSSTTSSNQLAPPATAASLSQSVSGPSADGSGSVVQSFSPPPVILPTRAGRRL